MERGAGVSSRPVVRPTLTRTVSNRSATRSLASQSSTPRARPTLIKKVSTTPRTGRFRGEVVTPTSTSISSNPVRTLSRPSVRPSNETPGETRLARKVSVTSTPRSIASTPRSRPSISTSARSAATPAERVMPRGATGDTRGRPTTATTRTITSPKPIAPTAKPATASRTQRTGLMSRTSSLVSASNAQSPPSLQLKGVNGATGARSSRRISSVANPSVRTPPTRSTRITTPRQISGADPNPLGLNRRASEQKQPPRRLPRAPSPRNPSTGGGNSSVSSARRASQAASRHHSLNLTSRAVIAPALGRSATPQPRKATLTATPRGLGRTLTPTSSARGLDRKTARGPTSGSSRSPKTSGRLTPRSRSPSVTSESSRRTSRTSEAVEEKQHSAPKDEATVSVARGLVANVLKEDMSSLPPVLQKLFASLAQDQTDQILYSVRTINNLTSTGKYARAICDTPPALFALLLILCDGYDTPSRLAYETLINIAKHTECEESKTRDLVIKILRTLRETDRQEMGEALALKLLSTPLVTLDLKLADITSNEVVEARAKPTPLLGTLSGQDSVTTAQTTVTRTEETRQLPKPDVFAPPAADFKFTVSQSGFPEQELQALISAVHQHMSILSAEIVRYAEAQWVQLAQQLEEESEYNQREMKKLGTGQIQAILQESLDLKRREMTQELESQLRVTSADLWDRFQQDLAEQVNALDPSIRGRASRQISALLSSETEEVGTSLKKLSRAPSAEEEQADLESVLKQLKQNASFTRDRLINAMSSKVKKVTADYRDEVQFMLEQTATDEEAQEALSNRKESRSDTIQSKLRQPAVLEWHEFASRFLTSHNRNLSEETEAVLQACMQEEEASLSDRLKDIERNCRSGLEEAEIIALEQFKRIRAEEHRVAELEREKRALEERYAQERFLVQNNVRKEEEARLEAQRRQLEEDRQAHAEKITHDLKLLDKRLEFAESIFRLQEASMLNMDTIKHMESLKSPNVSAINLEAQKAMNIQLCAVARLSDQTFVAAYGFTQDQDLQQKAIRVCHQVLHKHLRQYPAPGTLKAGRLGAIHYIETGGPSHIFLCVVTTKNYPVKLAMRFLTEVKNLIAPFHHEVLLATEANSLSSGLSDSLHNVCHKFFNGDQTFSPRSGMISPHTPYSPMTSPHAGQGQTATSASPSQFGVQGQVGVSSRDMKKLPNKIFGSRATLGKEKPPDSARESATSRGSRGSWTSSVLARGKKSKGDSKARTEGKREKCIREITSVLGDVMSSKGYVVMMVEAGLGLQDILQQYITSRGSEDWLNKLGVYVKQDRQAILSRLRHYLNGNGHEDLGTCGACHKEFTTNTSVSHKGARFHPGCFRCAICTFRLSDPATIKMSHGELYHRTCLKKALETSPAVMSPKGSTLSLSARDSDAGGNSDTGSVASGISGQILTPGGALSTLTAGSECERCGNPVQAQFVSAKGNAYHDYCFLCVNCGESLLKGYMSVDKKLLCPTCGKRKRRARRKQQGQPRLGSVAEHSSKGELGELRRNVSMQEDGLCEPPPPYKTSSTYL